MQIPAPLRAALEDAAQGTGAKTLRAASEAVSDRYRDRKGSLQIGSGEEARAYLATRFPATYAAARRSMDILKVVTGDDFRPRRLLDIGAGPGTVACAARDVWDIADMTLLEPNAYLRAAGQGILAQLAVTAAWLPASIDNADIGSCYDLVTAGYVLNELPEAQLEKTIEKLWAACTGVLMIIEPGTPQGSAVMQRARDWFIKTGAHILAPCPQSGKCPLRDAADRWCHFSVRVDRSRLHRQAKDASLSYEDEKFSFIAAGRNPAKLPDFRLIGHTAGTKVLRLQVCDSDGAVRTLDIPKSDPRHKTLRRLEWGDGF